MVTNKGSTIIGFALDVEGPQSPLKASNKWPICLSEPEPLPLHPEFASGSGNNSGAPKTLSSASLYCLLVF